MSSDPNYKRVRTTEKPEPDSDKPLNEIRVSAKGRSAVYLSYASGLWAPANPNPKEGEDAGPKIDPKTKKAFTSLTFKATGAALATVVTVVELLKRRFKGVEQITKLGSFEIEDTYEPVKSDAGLETKKQVRSVSYIEITLSRKSGELDKKAIGYQPALPDSEVEEVSVEDMLNPRSKKNKEGDEALGLGGKSGGKGGRKGRGKGAARGGKKGSKGRVASAETKGKVKEGGTKEGAKKKDSVASKDGEAKPTDGGGKRKGKGKGRRRGGAKKESETAAAA